MNPTTPHLKLTQSGALLLLNAAVEKAVAMQQPQCIAIVDDGCNLLAFLRMDGAKVLSEKSSIHKAMTAASTRAPTGNTAEGLDTRLALATGGVVTNLKGGLPIVIDGITVGGIGIGSGTGDQDREVANFALSALSGAATF
ncbi:MAG: heme-binding protein [Polaromonas sp.]|nr:heme-binding protein [Polaromonas sp.]